MAGIGGQSTLQYVSADNVAHGEQVHFTLRVHNRGDASIARAEIVRPLPANTRYVWGSAAGPAAELAFSSDGGRSFQSEKELRSNRRTPVDTGNLTHVRWRLKHPLASGAVALLRFRAQFR